ncbi:MAG: BrnT family toxin [Lachnospiraceae bacterium]|nr:BrnT family toxin [Lachnospiraceae bacterium]
MQNSLFEWDDKKNRSNYKKHGIRFETAARVFDDPYYIIWHDVDHSGYNKYGVWEDRYIVLGYVADILCVVYTVREYGDKEIIRIISARPAEGIEIDDYINSRGDVNEKNGK